jgi:hypothetical protein
MMIGVKEERMQNARLIKAVTCTVALLAAVAFQPAHARAAVTPDEAHAAQDQIKISFSAKPNKYGSITIHFGGDPKSVNYLPITEGWNYAIRMYQPRKEILDGSWNFPNIEPVK